MPGGRAAAGGQLVGHEVGELDDDHAVICPVGDDEQRPEILVPGIDEHDRRQRGDIGLGEGDQHVPQEPQGSRAVHPRGLDQLVGDGQEELAVQECAGRGRDQRQDQPGIGIEKVPLQRDLDPRNRVDQPADPGHVQQRLERRQGVRGDCIGWDDPHLQGQHQRDEHQPEDQHPAAELEEDDGEGGDAGHGDLAHHDPYGHDEAVDELRPEVRLDPSLAQVGPELVARPELYRGCVHLLQGQGRGDEGQPDRDQDQD